MHPPTAGEGWARHELERLRAGRFSSPAIAAFLAASHRRARDVRRARPELARQAHAWTAGGAAAWAGLAAAGVEPFRRRLAGGLAWWTFIGLMLDWHLGMLETDTGQPRRLGAADALTLTRVWLVPVIADDLRPAPLLAAAATDMLDGVAARATAPTRAGRHFDAMVDSAIVAAALASASRQGQLRPAVITLELARLTAGAGYVTFSYLAKTKAPDPALARAVRRSTPLRLAGLISAALGHPRAANALLALSSLASGALLAHPRTPDRPPS